MVQPLPGPRTWDSLCEPGCPFFNEYCLQNFAICNCMNPSDRYYSLVLSLRAWCFFFHAICIPMRDENCTNVNGFMNLRKWMPFLEIVEKIPDHILLKEAVCQEWSSIRIAVYLYLCHYSVVNLSFIVRIQLIRATPITCIYSNNLAHSHYFPCWCKCNFFLLVTLF